MSMQQLMQSPVGQIWQNVKDNNDHDRSISERNYSQESLLAMHMNEDE